MPLLAHEIKEAIAKKLIVVRGYVPENIGPNSLDLRLAPTLFEIHNTTLDLKKPLDKDLYVRKIPESGHVLEPGSLYLGVTREWIGTDHYVQMLEGRSTLARYGLTVHITAGVGDIGFKGHWTLEITTVNPIRVYPNMRVAQVIFEPVSTTNKKPPKILYKSRYSNRFHPVSPKPILPRSGNI